ncbi:MAG: hypothetical protein AAF211_17660 [Myxococcota bacterium]
MFAITAWFACTTTPGWLDEPAPLGDADCAPDTQGSTPPIGVTLPVRIRVGDGLDPAEAAFHTRWAGAYWRRRGVTLTVAAPWRRTRDAEVFRESAADLAALVEPLRDHLTRPVQPWVDVVFVSRLAMPASPAARYFQPLVGFTVADPDLPALRAVAQGATPTVFVSLEALRRLPRERARFVLAHELGHAMALGHVEARGNVMGPGFPRCAPGLDEAQVAAIRVWAARTTSRSRTRAR